MVKETVALFAEGVININRHNGEMGLENLQMKRHEIPTPHSHEVLAIFSLVRSRGSLSGGTVRRPYLDINFNKLSPIGSWGRQLRFPAGGRPCRHNLLKTRKIYDGFVRSQGTPTCRITTYDSTRGHCIKANTSRFTVGPGSQNRGGKKTSHKSHIRYWGMTKKSLARECAVDYAT